MKILIAGGSGLLGQALQMDLEDKGHEIRILSRSTPAKKGYFHWNPSEQHIDPNAFDSIDAVINLVGASISEGRWTAKRRKVLIESRVKSTQFLIQAIEQYAPKLAVYIGGAAVGIYQDTGEQAFDEQAPIGSDFMSTLAQQWEQAHQQIKRLSSTRMVIFRIGVVLTLNGGAYPVLKKNMILGIAPNFGKRVYYPIVHIDDVCTAFEWALSQKNATGIYNLCAPKPAHHLEVFKWISQTSWKPYIPIPVPKFALRIAMGEQSNIVTRSLRILPQRLLAEGFVFQYTDVKNVIKDLEQA